MSSFISVLKMDHIFYLETWELGMVNIKHIYLQKIRTSCEYKIKTMFKKKYNKKRKLNMNKHKAMRIIYGICQTNIKVICDG